MNNILRTKYFITLSLMISIFISFSAYAADGNLVHTIYSPYNTELTQESTTYYAGISTSASKTQITSPYRTLVRGYETDSEVIPSPEPFCKIGGWYKINVYNNPSPGASPTNQTFNFFYCKSTKDLIDMIKIPSTWTNANLNLYCNDGNQINFENVNFDILTTQLNTYKVCILKNQDLIEKNTIIYGFEVGNKIIDSDENNFFNSNSTNRILGDEGYSTNITLKNKTANHLITYYIPYENICYYHESYDNEGNPSFSEDCASRPAPGPGSPTSCPQHLETVYDEETDTTETIIVTESPCDHVTPQISSAIPNYTAFYHLADELSTAIYQVDTPIDYSEALYEYSKDNETLYFEYDPLYNSYSLRDTSETLETSIYTIFSINSITSFDLSRVAIFKQFDDGRKVYGYETPLKYKVASTESTKPLYRISFPSDVIMPNCEDTLASYGAINTPNFPTVSQQITCSNAGNKEIRINSLAMDNEFGEHTGFNLFKNIILDLE